MTNTQKTLAMIVLLAVGWSPDLLRSLDGIATSNEVSSIDHARQLDLLCDMMAERMVEASEITDSNRLHDFWTVATELTFDDQMPPDVRLEFVTTSQEIEAALGVADEAVELTDSSRLAVSNIFASHGSE